MNYKKKAKNLCANYGKGELAGICEGVMISRELQLWLKEELMGKSCIANQKDEDGVSKCPYFNRCVFSSVLLV